MDKLKQKIRGAMITQCGSQCAAAKVLGIHERRLSRLLNGHDEFKPEEHKLFKEKLGLDLQTAPTE